MSYFALLDSDSDNEAVAPKITAPKKEKEPKEKKEVAPVAKSAPVDVPASNKPNGKEKDVQPKKPKDQSNGEKKAPKELKSKKENTAPEKNVTAPVVTEPIEVPKDDPRGGGRGRGDRRREDSRGGRGRGRGENRSREKPAEAEETNKGDPSDHDRGLPKIPRKREFDRRSSTGRSGEQRKDSRGPHSFGNVKQEAAQAEKDPASAEPEIEPIDAVEETPAVTTDAVEEPVVEAPKVFTLDEYKKKKEEEKANTSHKELFIEPKPIRQVEASGFNGLKTKVEEEAIFMASNKTKNTTKKTSKQATVTAVTPSVELAFKVAPAEDNDSYERSNRPSRGGRENGRGGRLEGRGAGRSSGRPNPSTTSNSKTSIDVYDSNSFPSL